MTELKGRLIFLKQTQFTIISQFLASDSFGEAISKHISISCNEHSQGFTSLASMWWAANSLIEMGILWMAKHGSYRASSVSPTEIKSVIHMKPMHLQESLSLVPHPTGQRKMNPHISLWFHKGYIRAVGSEHEWSKMLVCTESDLDLKDTGLLFWESNKATKYAL